MRLPVVMASVALAALSLGAAVQQRSVAAHWRDLERQRTAAVSSQLDKQRAEIETLRTTRADLQGKLDTLAASRAATGDQADELTVLANRGQSLQTQLAACSAVVPADDTSCAEAAFQARQLLAALGRVAHP